MMRIGAGAAAAAARRSLSASTQNVARSARRLVHSQSGAAPSTAARVAACVATAAAAAAAGALVLASSSSHTVHASPAAGSASAAAAPAAAEEEDRFRSAQPLSDPDHPGLTLLTASEVDQLVYRRNQPNDITRLHEELLPLVNDDGAKAATAASSSSSATSSAAASSNDSAVVSGPSYAVLLDVYDPSCSACATLRPVVEALAAALQSEPSVRVMAYDDEANFRRGFLSDEERRELPLLKFYPQLAPAPAGSALHPAARQGVVYTGAPNTAALVDFIASHSPPESGFDAAAVRARLQSTAAATDTALRAAAEQRLSRDPVFHLYAQSPCGPPMMSWMRMTLVTRYLSTPIPEAEQKDAFNEFQRCVRDKDRAMRRYWHQLAAVAQDNLAKYDDKEKKTNKKQQQKQQQQQQENKEKH